MSLQDTQSRTTVVVFWDPAEALGVLDRDSDTPLKVLCVSRAATRYHRVCSQAIEDQSFLITRAEARARARLASTLLSEMARKPPTEVTTCELEDLVNLRLCQRHRDDFEVARDKLQRRFDTAKHNYILSSRYSYIQTFLAIILMLFTLGFAKVTPEGEQYLSQISQPNRHIGGVDIDAGRIEEVEGEEEE